jgi:hypothetical protein
VTKRPLTEEAVTYAGRRLDDLYRVHANEDNFQRVEAMRVVLDSFGDAQTIVDATDWLDRAGGTPEVHQPFLLGLLFGLLITRYHEDD